MPAVERLLAKYSDDIKRKNLKANNKKAAEVRAELTTELKLLLKNWKKGQEEKAKKKQEEEQKDDKHSPSYGDLSAILWRNSTYNNNCSKYMKKNSKRGDQFKMTAARKLRIDKAFGGFIHPVCVDHIKDNFGLGQRDENFSPNAKIGKKTAGNGYPYAWNGHHMIPCGVFYQGQKKDGMIKGVFNDDQYALLLMSDFNVNHGQNVIPLPSSNSFFQPIHDMVLHPSNHNNYTNMVQKKMKAISNDLKQLASKADEPHPDISVEIANELATFEDKLWKELVKIGKKVVDAMVAQKKAELTKEQESYIKEGALK